MHSPATRWIIGQLVLGVLLVTAVGCGKKQANRGGGGSDPEPTPEATTTPTPAPAPTKIAKKRTSVPSPTAPSANTPAPSPTAPTDPQPAKPVEAKTDPDFVLTAAALDEEIKKNKSAAAEKYGGKLLEVKDTVTGLQFNTRTGNCFLHLDGKPGVQGAEGLIVGMKDPDAWEKALPGQTVTVRTPNGESLLEAELIKVEGDPPTPLAAEALVTEYAKNAAAAGKKYDNRTLVITGVIDSVTPGSRGETTVKLKPARGKRQIELEIGNTPEQKKRGMTLKPGQRITVVVRHAVELLPLSSYLLRVEPDK
jgi:hypothetical protein